MKKRRIEFPERKIEFREIIKSQRPTYIPEIQIQQTDKLYKFAISERETMVEPPEEIKVLNFEKDLAGLVEEMTSLLKSGKCVLIETDCETAFAVIGALQLALRHPEFSKKPHTHDLVERFARSLCSVFDKTHFIKTVIEEGWKTQNETRRD
jgi:hypothetical protein